MKTLQINESNARKYYKTASEEFRATLEDTFGKDFFKEGILDRVKTIADVYREHNVKESDMIPYADPKTKRQKVANAVIKMDLISELLNEGEKMDFNDRNKAKYFVWFERTASGWVVSYVFGSVCLASAGSGFWFKDAKTARHATEYFMDVFIDYLPE